MLHRPKKFVVFNPFREHIYIYNYVYIWYKSPVNNGKHRHATCNPCFLFQAPLAAANPLNRMRFQSQLAQLSSMGFTNEVIENTSAVSMFHPGLVGWLVGWLVVFFFFCCWGGGVMKYWNTTQCQLNRDYLVIINKNDNQLLLGSLFINQQNEMSLWLLLTSKPDWERVNGVWVLQSGRSKMKDSRRKYIYMYL